MTTKVKILIKAKLRKNKLTSKTQEIKYLIFALINLYIYISIKLLNLVYIVHVPSTVKGWVYSAVDK